MQLPSGLVCFFLPSAQRSENILNGNRSVVMCNFWRQQSCPSALAKPLHLSRTDNVSIGSYLLCVAVWFPGLYHAAGKVGDLGAIRPHFEAVDT